MEIRRFYVDKNDIINEVATVKGKEFNHAINVLRQKTGYTVILNTGDDYDYYATIEEINKSYFTARIFDKKINFASPDVNITLFQGSCKLGKNDFIIQKAVELGVKRIVFFDSQNVVEKKLNLERLAKIATAASKQCGRADTVSVEFVTYSEAIKEASKQKSILFYEDEKENKLNNLFFPDKGNVSLIVGSEGGFTDLEVRLAKDNSIVVCSLGKRILRAETAAIVSVALVSYLCGGLG